LAAESWETTRRPAVLAQPAVAATACERGSLADSQGLFKLLNQQLTIRR
jgi:hypothetical protein